MAQSPVGAEAASGAVGAAGAGDIGSHFPDTDARLARINLVTRQTSDGLGIVEEPLPEMPSELQALLTEGGGH